MMKKGTGFCSWLVLLLYSILCLFPSSLRAQNIQSSTLSASFDAPQISSATVNNIIRPVNCSFAGILHEGKGFEVDATMEAFPHEIRLKFSAARDLVRQNAEAKEIKELLVKLSDTLDGVDIVQLIGESDVPALQEAVAGMTEAKKILQEAQRLADTYMDKATMGAKILDIVESAQTALATGGLGFLAGETHQVFKEVGINAIGFKPLYHRSKVSKNVVSWSDIAGVSAFMVEQNGEEKQFVLDIPFNGKTYETKFYVEERNGTSVVMPYQPEIFDILYPSGESGAGLEGLLAQWRQYAFLGVAYVEFCKALGVAPDILRLNEAQTVFAAIAMENDRREKRDKSIFKDTQIVFTTHTAEVAALPEWEDVSMMREALGYDMVPDWMIEISDGIINLGNVAAELATIINSVADEHKYISRWVVFKRWAHKIMGIVNGSDPDFWKTDALKKTIRDKAKKENVSYQEAVATAEGKDLLDAAQETKRDLQTYLQAKGLKGFSDLDRPMIGMVRRITGYKSQDLYIPLIRWICGDADKEYTFTLGDGTQVTRKGLAQNILIGGIPSGKEADEWASTFMQLSQELEGRFVFLPQTGTKFMKLAAGACDGGWLHTPLETREACGTSYERADFNGVPSIASFVGGPIEQISHTWGEHGWLTQAFDKKWQEESGYTMRDVVRILNYDDKNEEKKALIRIYKIRMQKKLVGLLDQDGNAVDQAGVLQQARKLYDDRTEWQALMKRTYDNAHVTMTTVVMAEKYKKMFDWTKRFGMIKGTENLCQNKVAGMISVDVKTAPDTLLEDIEVELWYGKVGDGSSWRAKKMTCKAGIDRNGLMVYRFSVDVRLQKDETYDVRVTARGMKDLDEELNIYHWAHGPRAVSSMMTDSVSDKEQRALLTKLQKVFAQPPEEVVPLEKFLDESLTFLSSGTVSDELKEYVDPYVLWDMDGNIAFPDNIDRNSWLVLQSASPFRFRSGDFHAAGGDDRPWITSVQYGDSYIAFLPPTTVGGRKYIDLQGVGYGTNTYALQTLRYYYKRENTQTYIPYARKLLQELELFLQRNSVGEYARLCSQVTAALQKRGYSLNGGQFRFEMDNGYTLGNEHDFLMTSAQKNTKDETELLLSFKLVNALKRHRIDMSREDLFVALLINLALSLDLVDQEYIDGRFKYSAPYAWITRLREADQKKREEVRLVQLNARVQGQHPQEITDGQIQEWKSQGINTVYLMGAWKESPYSAEYSKKWHERDVREGKTSWEHKRKASAFSVFSYDTDKAEIQALVSRLKKHGMRLMLDFVTNHMAMDNPYLVEHPEYFKHERLGSNYYINTASDNKPGVTKYVAWVPAHWPRYESGAVRFKLWHANFDLNGAADHFLVQEFDEVGRQINVLKFYHGNHSWRDTVQIDYQNPSAREFMRKQYLKIVELTEGGGVRWDFVHIDLMNNFRKAWGVESDEEFRRIWKGVDHIARKSKDEWAALFDVFVNAKECEPLIGRLHKLEPQQDAFEDMMSAFKQFIQKQEGIWYMSLAPAFHYEGLKDIIRMSLFPDMTQDEYRELYEAIPDLRFHEIAERNIIEARKKFPQVINIAEAYSEEAYLISCGMDAVYDQSFRNTLVEDLSGGKTSFPDAVGKFFNTFLGTIPQDWPLSKRVVNIQNFDNDPVINKLSYEEVLFLLTLGYGLPGVKYYEWGLINANRSRLGADYVLPNIDRTLQEKLKPFVEKVMTLSSNEVIEKGDMSRFYLSNSKVDGYTRRLGNTEIRVLTNAENYEKRVSLSDMQVSAFDVYSIILKSNSVAALEGDYLLLPPKSAVWIEITKDLNLPKNTVSEDHTVVLQAA